MVSSFFNLSKHIAHFYDNRGEFVGSKCFKTSFNNSRGLKEKTFDYNKGSYNINCFSSRGYTGHLLFNEFIYTYTLDNPDPWRISSDASPIMDSKIYKKRLTNHFIEQLHEAGKVGNWGDLFTVKNMIILAIVIGGIVYLTQGGSVLPSG